MSIQVGENANTEMTRLLSQPCHKFATMLFYNLVTTLYFECYNVVARLSQGCTNIVTRLSQSCLNLITRLLICTFSQVFITKLATTLYSVTRVSQVGLDKICLA